MGLINLGNTCYFNSVIQALHQTKKFRNIVLGSSSTEKSPLLSSLKNLFRCMSHGTGLTLFPVDFFRESRPAWFVAGDQQDCSEFLTSLFSQITEESEKEQANHVEIEVDMDDDDDNNNKHDDLIPGKPMNAFAVSTIQNIFGGQLETSHECLKCKTVSCSTDWFTDLHIPMVEEPPQKPLFVLPNRLANLPSISVSLYRDQINEDVKHNLNELISVCLEPELLSGENQYQCDFCHSLQDARKTIQILTAPEVLLLVLLRFKYCTEIGGKKKLLSLVEYPEIVTLEVSGRRVNYRLQTVVVHTGLDSQEGHYYTWARQEDDRWLVLNDTVVIEDSWNRFLEDNELQKKETPYLLFYRQEDFKISPSVVV